MTNVLVIPDSLEDRVLGKGETGMGFQVIRAVVTYALQTGTKSIEGPCLVLGSVFILPYAPYPDIVAVQDLPAIGLAGDFPPGRVSIDDLVVMSVFWPRITTPLSMSHSGPPIAGTGLALPVSTTTSTHQAFLRFSAFPNDKRILTNGGLLPDTFATTVNDARLAPSGLAAVGRYALPNPLPAKFVYTVVPPAGTQIQMGAVLPNNGQAGGGVEVWFPKGCAQHTLLPYELPEA